MTSLYLESFEVRKMNIDQLASVSFFSAEHIVRVCENLEESGDFERLARFLWALDFFPSTMNLFIEYESLRRARVLVAFHSANYRQLYQLLENYSYERQCHVQLQTIWMEAHYREAEKIRGRALGPVKNRKISSPMMLFEFRSFRLINIG